MADSEGYSGERETDRQTETDRDRETERDRQTGRQTGRQTKTETEHLKGLKSQSKIGKALLLSAKSI